MAQVPSQKSPAPGRVDGQVISDRDEQPLRRAHVTLRPAESGLTTVGAECDDHGHFDIRQIAPGSYTLIADRDGYLSSATAYRGAARMAPVISIDAGQSIRNLTFRLKPWAVFTGKIRWEDGEPAANIRVDAYREIRQRGRHYYARAASAITNDLGQYRLYGLHPGAYFIAADYERAAPGQGFREQPQLDADGQEVPAFTYTTTFYPNTVKFSEAAATRIDYGQELGGIDIFLRQVRKVSVRGSATSELSGERLRSASIFLERLDAHNLEAMQVSISPRFNPVTDRFEIRDLTPGSYVISAEGSEGDRALRGSALLQIGDQDAEGVELMLAPQKIASAKVVVEGGGTLDAKASLVASMEPRGQRAPTTRGGVQDGLMVFSLTASETYDLYIDNLPGDFYISEIRVNGANAMVNGIPGMSASGDLPFEIVLDSRGGKVVGRVASEDGVQWSGANVMLIPDPPQGRAQSYRQGGADEHGQFLIRGVAPGRYVLVAWLDEAPCDVYDPLDLNACRSAGMPVVVAQGGQENVQFTPRGKW